jgi:hypothetical protein
MRAPRLEQKMAPRCAVLFAVDRARWVPQEVADAAVHRVPVDLLAVTAREHVAEVSALVLMRRHFVSCLVDPRGHAEAREISPFAICGSPKKLPLVRRRIMSWIFARDCG